MNKKVNIKQKQKDLSNIICSYDKFWSSFGVFGVVYNKNTSVVQSSDYTAQHPTENTLFETYRSPSVWPPLNIKNWHLRELLETQLPGTEKDEHFVRWTGGDWDRQKLRLSTP